MYGLLREGLNGISLRRASDARAAIGSTVVFLGMTSLLTDISSEMVSAVLPIYMLFYQRATPLQLGIVDGLYQGGSAIFRLLTGFIADRMGRQKEIATSGYGLSALARVGMVLSTGPAAFAGLILVDRFGKGIRTAPRDALISLSAPPESLGMAFGLHRTLDTFGAMVGPIVAFGLLATAPQRFDVVFVVSLAFAILGVSTIALFVRNPDRPAPAVEVEPPSLRAAFDLLRLPAFRLVVVAGAAVSLLTVSDAFVYVVLQRTSGLDLGLFPLLYVGTSAAYLLAAIPLGGIADRFGRFETFLAGQVLLLIVYGVLLTTPVTGFVLVGVVVVLYGVFYAATDGVLMAAASATLPESLRTSGLSFVGTVVAVARLVSSLLFGLLWTWRGPEAALVVFLVGLVLAVGFVLLRHQSARREGASVS